MILLSSNGDHFVYELHSAERAAVADLCNFHRDRVIVEMQGEDGRILLHVTSVSAFRSGSEAQPSPSNRRGPPLRRTRAVYGNLEVLFSAPGVSWRTPGTVPALPLAAPVLPPAAGNSKLVAILGDDLVLGDVIMPGGDSRDALLRSGREERLLEQLPGIAARSAAGREIERSAHQVFPLASPLLGYQALLKEPASGSRAYSISLVCLLRGRVWRQFAEGSAEILHLDLELEILVELLSRAALDGIRARHLLGEGAKLEQEWDRPRADLKTWARAFAAG